MANINPDALIQDLSKYIENWLLTLDLCAQKNKNSLFLSVLEYIKQKIAIQSISVIPKYIHNLHKGLEAAANLVKLGLDQHSLCASILLPLFKNEYNLIDAAEIDAISVQIMPLIVGVKQMNAIRYLHTSSNYKTNEQQRSDNIRKMLLAMVKDVRIVIIKLTEHIADLRDKNSYDQQQLQLLAQETQKIYAPLANRLGIGQLKWELEDLAFRILEPYTYKQIAKLLDEKRSDREKYIYDFVEEIQKLLTKHNISAKVNGRAKHIYSIWRKMTKKGLNYDEIYDIRAIRIITNNLPNCYASLGLLHSKWSNLQQEFDDYIATPKQNGYQSLHTAIIGPAGKIVEIQIRTQDMHEDAELGIAAHWVYKEGEQKDNKYKLKIAWLRKLLNYSDNENNVSNTDSDNLIEEIKSNIEEDRIYVLTPKGDIFDLPIGATPIDLAYLIHTDIGHNCKGAKVNAKMVPLNSGLNTGDKVEIITIKNTGPSRDWLNQNLNYIKTNKARNKISSWFKKQNYDNNITIGKELLHKELKILNIKNLALEEILPKLKLKTVNDVYAALGHGDLKIAQILNAANTSINTEHKDKSNLDINKDNNLSLNKTEDNYYKNKIKYSLDNNIQIIGLDNLLNTVAKCCKPLPGDEIVGYITQNKGITIHRHDCPNIYHLKSIENDRLIAVQWKQNSIDNIKKYHVSLEIFASNNANLLQDIIHIFTQENINVVKLHSSYHTINNTIKSNVLIQVSNLDQLVKTMERINNIPSIIKVNRNIE